MRMLFEVQDLAAASPATVSRCGMVYVAGDTVGWRPLVASWVSGGIAASGGADPLANACGAAVWVACAINTLPACGDCGRIVPAKPRRGCPASCITAWVPAAPVPPQAGEGGALARAAPQLSKEQRAAVAALCEAHVGAGLAWLQRCDAGVTPLPAVEGSLVAGLLSLLQVRYKWPHPVVRL